MKVARLRRTSRFSEWFGAEVYLATSSRGVHRTQGSRPPPSAAARCGRQPGKWDRELIDNGPDVSRCPAHAGELAVYAAPEFDSGIIPIGDMANRFEQTLSCRVVGGAP